MTAHTRVVVHDIPVAVIPTRFWENFQKPILPAYDVSESFKCDVKTLKNHKDLENLEIGEKNPLCYNPSRQEKPC